MRFREIRALFAGGLPKLAMFDLDGTLIDSVPDIARALNRTLAHFECAAVPEARVRGWVGRGARRLVEDAFGLRAGARAADPQLIEAALAHYLACYLADCTRGTRLLEGGAELLSGLAGNGVRLACVTNKAAAITERVLAHCGVAMHFTRVLGGDSGAGSKPSPEPLRRVMAELAVRPDEALMIGDSRHDVHAARAAGVAVICVAGGYNHGEDVRAEAPDRVVPSLGDLL